MDIFLEKLSSLPSGYSQGEYEGERYGVTLTRRGDRQLWLFAEALAGSDIISFNLYRLKDGVQLKPCEMSSQKVIDFVVGYVPDGAR